MKRGIFLGEGTSDSPLADLIVTMFRRLHVNIDVSTPDLALLPHKFSKDLPSKIRASLELTNLNVDLFIVHRDADGAGRAARLGEIQKAVEEVGGAARCLPVVPVRMTEAWLLLDEQAIRNVSGNPRGRAPLNLPRANQVERRADPKALLAEAILSASEQSGRRRDQVSRRFNQHRRQLLERLDLDGEVTQLQAWKDLVADVESAASTFSFDQEPEPRSTTKR